MASRSSSFVAISSSLILLPVFPANLRGGPSLKRFERFVSGTFTRLHSAIHIAIPDGGRLRPSPMNPAYRLTQRAAIRSPDAWRHIAGVAAARVFIGSPIFFQIFSRPRRLLTKIIDQAGNNGLPTLLQGSLTPDARGFAFHKAQ